MLLNPFDLINSLIDEGCVPSQARFSPGKDGKWFFDFRLEKKFRRIEYRGKEKRLRILERKYLRYKEVATIRLSGSVKMEDVVSEILNAV